MLATCPWPSWREKMQESVFDMKTTCYFSLNLQLISMLHQGHRQFNNSCLLTEFPAVTICDINFYQNSVMKEHPELKNFFENVFRFHTPTDLESLETLRNSDFRSFLVENVRNVIAEFHDFSRCDDDTMCQRWLQYFPPFIASCIFSLLKQLTDIVKECRYANLKRDPGKYFVPIRTEVGRCYTFNSNNFRQKNGSLKTTRPGPTGGLHLRLFANQDEYSWGPMSSAGFKVENNHLHTHAWFTFASSLETASGAAEVLLCTSCVVVFFR